MILRMVVSIIITILVRLILVRTIIMVVETIDSVTRPVAVVIISISRTIITIVVAIVSVKRGIIVSPLFSRVIVPRANLSIIGGVIVSSRPTIAHSVINNMLLLVVSLLILSATMPTIP